MTWNYRIVKYKDGSGFGLHEVFYNDDGSAFSMTEEAIRFTADAPDELVKDLEMALSDTKREVFEEPEEWAMPDWERDSSADDIEWSDEPQAQAAEE